MFGSANVEQAQTAATDSAPGNNAGASSGEVAHQITELTRTMSRFRAAVATATEAGDWIGNRLLFAIVTHGPMRSGELAECVHADPSTVSRQVAILVRDGMLERRADPNDGRAILLHATESGRRRHDADMATRQRYYRSMLQGWSEAEQAQFAGQLRRFIADFHSYEPTLLADIVRAAKRHQADQADPPDQADADERRAGMAGSAV